MRLKCEFNLMQKNSEIPIVFFYAKCFPQAVFEAPAFIVGVYLGILLEYPH